MKLLILTALIFLSLNSYGQKDIVGKNIHFKIVEYIKGSFYRERIESVDTSGLAGNKIDLYFFRKYFYRPYYMPDRFINSKYKSETVTIWVNGKEDTTSRTNWKQTFTYDSLSRVVKYTSSSCFVCNFLPYSYNVSYNKSGQVMTIVNSTNFKETFKIYYDGNVDVKQLDHLIFGKLDERIIRGN
ncbi:MAG TPA: hypothetical protein VNX40_00745 [Mucilaginibacter sp.]|jgi:hypothetical protein|nr:hypothetical protein [Mucilaginibacter sp.]